MGKLENKNKPLNGVNWEDIESSNIKQLNYDPTQRILGIRFKGNRTYYYHPITEEGYLSLKKAESIGKHFKEFIKNNENISTYVEE